MTDPAAIHARHEERYAALVARHDAQRPEMERRAAEAGERAGERAARRLAAHRRAVFIERLMTRRRERPNPQED